MDSLQRRPRPRKHPSNQTNERTNERATKTNNNVTNCLSVYLAVPSVRSFCPVCLSLYNSSQCHYPPNVFCVSVLSLLCSTFSFSLSLSFSFFCFCPALLCFCFSVQLFCAFVGGISFLLFADNQRKIKIGT